MAAEDNRGVRVLRTLRGVLRPARDFAPSAQMATAVI
jgi:hypothetical protein